MTTETPRPNPTPRTVDSASDPDLFWALRGGGGGYAIVTALHVDLLPIAEAYAGSLLLPAELPPGFVLAAITARESLLRNVVVRQSLAEDRTRAEKARRKRETMRLLADVLRIHRAQ